MSPTCDIATRVVATRDFNYKAGNVTGHRDPEGEYKYGCTLSLTSAVDGVGGQHYNPAALPSGKRPLTHFTVGWVGPRAGLDGCLKSLPHRISVP